MSIIRIRKENKYAIISNAVLNDSTLTWEGRGIMAYLLSKPDGWECRNYDLVKQGPVGKHVIQRVINELQEAGYIYRYRVSDGRAIEWVTEIYESPQLNTTSRNTDIPTSEEPTVGKPEVGKPGHIVSTDLSNDLPKEITDFNGSAKNSQTQLEEANNDYSPEKNSALTSPYDYSPDKKDDLNTLVPHIATISDIQDKEELKAVVLFGYEVAQVCKLELALTSISNLKSIARLTLALHAKNLKVSDLKAFSNWWYNENWKGKKGQAPNPGDLGDNWGQFEAQKVANVPLSADGDGGFYV